VPAWFHAAAGAVVAAALYQAWLAATRVPILVEEDGFLEWMTAALFFTAGGITLWRAARERRAFDALIGLFCLFVAGEEVSWGQRLLGFTPPEYFLEHNGQQELNVHNFAHPRSIFSIALIGFGVVMPLAARWSVTGRLMDRIGATAPPLSLVPWIVSAVLLTQWDPRKITSEFAECLAGGLFLAATWRAGWEGRRSALGSAVAALLLTGASGLRGGDEGARIACAGREIQALQSALLSDPSLTASLMERAPHGPVRVSTYIERREIPPARLAPLEAVRCEIDGARDAHRRRFAVDPWGLSYQLSLVEQDGARSLVVSSFGPNRRADGSLGNVGGDDLSRTIGTSAGQIATASPQ
jgi:hypothetical protein